MTEVPAVVGVDPRADPAVVGIEQVEVGSQSSTKVVPSDAEDEDMVLVELPESSLACLVFDLSPAGSPASQDYSIFAIVSPLLFPDQSFFPEKSPIVS